MFGLKAIAVKPGNPARGLDPHPGLVLVLDPGTAAPIAAVDGTSLTAIRTAAVSAVATDALARPDAGVLALLGSGTRTHPAALALVRELREVRVWSRDPDRARALVESAVDHPVVRAGSVAEAVAGADLICTTTSSPTPLLEAGMVAAGAHVNAVGAVFPDRREPAGGLVGRAGVFVDSRESALVEAGDLLSAMREGHFTASDIRAGIGEVLLGVHPGRGGDDDEVTVFESPGLAVEDVMAARHVRERAAGLG